MQVPSTAPPPTLSCTLAAGTDPSDGGCHFPDRHRLRVGFGGFRPSTRPPRCLQRPVDCQSFTIGGGTVISAHNVKITVAPARQRHQCCAGRLGRRRQAAAGQLRRACRWRFFGGSTIEASKLPVWDPAAAADLLRCAGARHHLGRLPRRPPAEVEFRLRRPTPVQGCSLITTTALPCSTSRWSISTQPAMFGGVQAGQSARRGCRASARSRLRQLGTLRSHPESVVAGWPSST